MEIVYASVVLMHSRNIHMKGKRLVFICAMVVKLRVWLMPRCWTKLMMRCQWHVDLALAPRRDNIYPGVLHNWPPSNSASYSQNLPHVTPPSVDFTLDSCAHVLQEVLRWSPSVLEGCCDDEARAGEVLALEHVAGVLLNWRNQLAVAVGQHITRETALGKFKYDAAKLLKCVMLSRHLRNKQCLQTVIQHGIEIATPAFVGRPLSAGLQAKIGKLHSHKIPSRTTVSEHELFLDLAIVHLTSVKFQDTFVRYGWSDSSPIAGYDWLWAQELCINQANLLDVMLAVHSQPAPKPHNPGSAARKKTSF